MMSGGRQDSGYVRALAGSLSMDDRIVVAAANEAAIGMDWHYEVVHDLMIYMLELCVAGGEGFAYNTAFSLCGDLTDDIPDDEITEAAGMAFFRFAVPKFFRLRESRQEAVDAATSDAAPDNQDSGDAGGGVVAEDGDGWGDTEPSASESDSVESVGTGICVVNSEGQEEESSVAAPFVAESDPGGCAPGDDCAQAADARRCVVRALIAAGASIAVSEACGDSAAKEWELLPHSGSNDHASPSLSVQHVASVVAQAGQRHMMSTPNLKMDTGDGGSHYISGSLSCASIGLGRIRHHIYVALLGWVSDHHGTMGRTTISVRPRGGGTKYADEPGIVKPPDGELVGSRVLIREKYWGVAEDELGPMPNLSSVLQYLANWPNRGYSGGIYIGCIYQRVFGMDLEVSSIRVRRGGNLSIIDLARYNGDTRVLLS